ncbi:hypothetical protein HOK15_02540 [Candidatus Falkowbacteria bacterium]|nr:hypothetical protein [Candidatus Falkowbacteria bacterium]
MYKFIIVAISIFVLSSTSYADGKEDYEKARLEQIKKWGGEGIPKPEKVAADAKSLFSKPLAEQTEEELKKMAKTANISANFVGYILEEYSSYYSDNYRYDFIQEKVGPYHDKYVQLSNDLKDYRNKAYFNLGKKMKESGKELEAFFYYKDAFSLASFTESEGEHKGMRYLAEQEMKALMGISEMGSFVYWK